MKKYSDYAYNFIKRILEEVGPRESGSNNEAKGAKIIQDELKNFCDEVDCEPFEVHPKAFLGWIKIVVWIYIASSFLLLIPYWLPASYLFICILVVSINIFSVLLLYFEFVRYKLFSDPLYPKKISHNVVGKINPTEKPSKILIFSSHNDSAYEFNLIKWGGGKYTFILTILGIAPILVLCGFSIITLVVSIALQSYWQFVVIFLLLLDFFSPFIIIFSFFVSDKVVPGAADDLSGTSICLAVGKYLKDNFRPKNTLIYILSLGSEEAALRGSKKFVKRHYNEIKNAIDINIESTVDPNKINLIEKEQTATLSREICEEVLEVSKKLDLNPSIQQLFFGSGGTDAASFANTGIKAISIICKSIKPDYFYHTMKDTLDIINKEALENVIKICVNYAKYIDEK